MLNCHYKTASKPTISYDEQVLTQFKQIPSLSILLGDIVSQKHLETISTFR